MPEGHLHGRLAGLGPDAVRAVSSCSRHGFKHSAAVGEAAAEIMTEGRSSLDLSPSGLARFRGHEGRY
jgi:sarcosine oxidase